MKKSFWFSLVAITGAVLAMQTATLADERNDRAADAEYSASEASGDERASARGAFDGQVPLADWTSDEIHRNPDGYFERVIAELRDALEAITPAVEELEVSVDELTQHINDKTELFNKTRGLALEFKRHFRKAERDNCWPVEVCGKKYSKERLESQICRLAVQAATFKAAIEQLQNARERAEAGLEEAETRPTQLEVEAITTRMLQRLYRVQQIPSPGPEILSRIEGLVANPAHCADPDELLRALAGCHPIKPIEGPRRQIARQYLEIGGLAQKPKTESDRLHSQAEAAVPIFQQQ